MGGSHSFGLHNSSGLRRCSSGRLDCPLWCSGHHHNHIGVQFTSAIWSVLCKRLGIQHVTTTSYHPQSNGLVERFHRQLKDSLRARLAVRDWPSHLPWVLLGLRSAPKEDHNVSSAELLYGIPLALPGELLDSKEPPATTFLEHLRTTPASLPTRPLGGPEPAAAPPKGLSSADFVFVRRGDRLKPCLVNDVTQASPPSGGRPRKT